MGNVNGTKSLKHTRPPIPAHWAGRRKLWLTENPVQRLEFYDSPHGTLP